jgi:hypothetical protein
MFFRGPISTICWTNHMTVTFWGYWWRVVRRAWGRTPLLRGERFILSLVAPVAVVLQVVYGLQKLPSAVEVVAIGFEAYALVALVWLAFNIASGPHQLAREQDTAAKTLEQEIAPKLRRRELHERLGLLVDEGERLKAALESPTIPYTGSDVPEQVDDWNKRTENCLRELLSESYAARFRSTAGMQFSLIHRARHDHHVSLWRELDTRIPRLHQILQEYPPG